MLSITPIPAFTDNYIWMMTSPDVYLASVVDPGDAAPVLSVLKANNLRLENILITHHHPDHTGGIEELLHHYPNCNVYGPANENIPAKTQALVEGDRVDVNGQRFEVIDIPGHTAGHIGYYADEVLFCGDTLFSGGCGRLFEGTPAQMCQSLAKLAALPDSTQVYCTHEYTLANLKFAIAVEPENQKLQQCQQRASILRSKNNPTLPTSIGLEKLINPFLRTQEKSVVAAAESYVGNTIEEQIEVFAAIRRWKDNF
jgi:hydroxyacylglutathione hydrolase